jgi:hypothetical protein
MHAAARTLRAAVLVAVLLATVALAIEPAEWAVYRGNIAKLPAANGAATVGETLGAFLDYKFDLPMEFMRRAQVRCRAPQQCAFNYGRSRAGMLSGG